MSFQFDQNQLNSLYQYAMVLCQQADDAYDLLQASLESYLKQQQKQAIEHPMAFLRTLIRNRFIDQYRYQQRWDTSDIDDDASYNISPLDLEDLCIQQNLLETIWQDIAVADRDILYHWAVLGYSTDEACEILGLSRGTFLSRIHRLRKKLQANYADTPMNSLQGGHHHE